MGNIVKSIQLRDVWGSIKHYKPLPALRCYTDYTFLPKFACTSALSCKIPYSSSMCDEELTILSSDTNKSHTDLFQTKLCKVLESDAVERS